MGKGKARDSVEVPNVTKTPQWTVLGEPFVARTINAVVFDGSLRVSKDFYAHAAKNLTKSAMRKKKYMLYVAWLGKEVQASLRILEQERRLDVQSWKKAVSFNKHPAIRSASFNTTLKVKSMDDEKWLVWYTAIRDILDMLEAEVLKCMENHRMARLPDYTT